MFKSVKENTSALMRIARRFAASALIRGRGDKREQTLPVRLVARPRYRRAEVHFSRA